MLTDLDLPLLPIWVIRAAVAAVWLYEGLWCKLLGRGAGQLEVAQAVPFLGSRWAGRFLRLLGTAELGIALWVLSGVLPGLCAVTQTGLLVSLNTAGISWARRRIHDPAGMVLKNAALLTLAWVAAALPRVIP
ncbi:MAG TPA: DoxX-like family protein [Polyangiaceae bacterium]